MKTGDGFLAFVVLLFVAQIAFIHQLTRNAAARVYVLHAPQLNVCVREAKRASKR
jgi:hypothetical protein